MDERFGLPNWQWPQGLGGFEKRSTEVSRHGRVYSSLLPGFSQAFVETGFSVPRSDGRQSIVFRGRYSRLIPLRIDQRSYVLVSAMDQAADGHVAVIKPLPSARAC